jgi:hypothetical protein
VPATVNLALAELAGETRKGCRRSRSGLGLQVIAAIMEEDATAACGADGHHDPESPRRRGDEDAAEQLADLFAKRDRVDEPSQSCKPAPTPTTGRLLRRRVDS